MALSKSVEFLSVSAVVFAKAGFDTYLYRKYAIEPRGQKIHEAVNKRTSIVAGKIGHKILAP